jgi:tRNA-Thr(GGU) m(6)t(6)A37 methyltransferase TsaA
LTLTWCQGVGLKRIDAKRNIGGGFMISYTLHPVGSVHAGEDGFLLKLDEPFKPCLKGLAGFGYIQVLCWFDKTDTEEARNFYAATRPYKAGPEEMGVFATRGPIRPNPIALCTMQVLLVNEAAGEIRVAWTDMMDGTPILDIKPYTPSLDRVEYPNVPAWCDAWPKNVETSGDFDWSDVFNF